MTQETLEKIKKLRLFGMARAYETSLENDKLLSLSADELIKMLVSQCKAEDDSYLCNYKRNFTSINAKILPAEAGPGVTRAMWQLFLALIVQIALMAFSIGIKVPSGLLIPSMSIGAIAGRMLGIITEQLA